MLNYSNRTFGVSNYTKVRLRLKQLDRCNVFTDNKLHLAQNVLLHHIFFIITN